MAVAERIRLQMSSEDIKATLRLHRRLSHPHPSDRPHRLRFRRQFLSPDPSSCGAGRGLEEIRTLFGIQPAAANTNDVSCSRHELVGTVDLRRPAGRHCAELARGQGRDGGKQVRVQPGVIGARANATLAPYRAKIGPDPASIATCTMGGILSNNSSGMCLRRRAKCLSHTEVHEVHAASGTVIDTSQPDADAEFHAREPELARGVWI